MVARGWWSGEEEYGYKRTTEENPQMYKLELEKAEESETKLPTYARSLKKQGNSKKKHIYFIDYAKAFDSMDHNKLWNILKEMGIPDHLSCLLRKLYAGQEAC